MRLSWVEHAVVVENPPDHDGNRMLGTERRPPPTAASADATTPDARVARSARNVR